MEVMPRYGGHVYGETDVAWKVCRIMLKYRPIAPKPVTGSAATAAPVALKSSSGRGKRKGSSSSKERKRGRKTAKNTLGAFSEGKSDNSHNPFVTLPLMPVTPERKEEELSLAKPSPTGSDAHVAVNYFGIPSWKRVGSTNANSKTVVAPKPMRPMGSWVTVEYVTDTWQGSEIPAGFENDACPVFFSDANGERVTWMNAAYKRMVVGPDSEEEGEEVKVALVTRGLVPNLNVRVTSFTCRVRVQYACRRRGKVSVVVPCDVWRMGVGGLAWRLDVKAALSLSLGS